MQSEALEKTITGLGYELVEASRDAGGTLRVAIDSPEGVGTTDCERVSSHLGYYLPVEGIDYRRLEVSSPGLDRPLTKPEHYARFVGRKASVRSRLPIDGRSNFKGTIAASDSESVRLETDGGGMSLRFEDIKAARLHHEYESLRGAQARGKERR